MTVLLTAVCVLGVARAVEHPTGAGYWAAPYTPTRVEWLALQLNVEAGKRCDYQRDPDCFGVDFSALDDSSGLGLSLTKGATSEQIAREETVRAVEAVRMQALSYTWSGKLPPITIFETGSKGSANILRCIPRVVTGFGSMLKMERYKTAQLTNVCDSLTRQH